MTRVAPLRAETADLSQRVPPLDGLRGLAIILVMIHHFMVFDPAGYWGTRVAAFSEFAAHGVDLFFVLSGFLITSQLAQNIGRLQFATEFWVKRLAKILPLYLAAVVVVFVGLKWALLWTGHLNKLRWLESTDQNWPWYVFFGSNLRNALDGRFTNPALDVCWSLGIEVQFYLLAFCAARWVRRERWLALALCTIGGAFLFRAAAWSAGANWVQILVLTPGRLDAFAFGAVVALSRRSVARWPVWPVVLLVLLPWFFDWSRARPSCELFGYSAVGLSAAILIERTLHSESTSLWVRFLSSRPLVFMGRISYSVYLIHLPLRAALRDGFLPERRVLDTPTAWWSQLVFTFGTAAACVLVGGLAWSLFEEPVRRRIVRRYGGRRVSVVTPVV